VPPWDHGDRQGHAGSRRPGASGRPIPSRSEEGAGGDVMAIRGRRAAGG
jgi:hypothetical protein